MANNKCFIYETLNDVKTMQVEKTNDGFMHLSGVFGVCGVRNNNQRVYETKNYSAMVSEMQGRIKNEGGIPGELEHPNTMNITLENISHKINSISIDENGVVTGEITLLNTPKGQIAQAIVEGGLPLYISSRAQGVVDKSGNVKLENLKTYDLVGSPGFSQAKLHLNENQVAESICESIYYVADKEDDTQDTIVKENNNDDNMDKEALTQLQESIAQLQSRIDYLEEQNNALSQQIEESTKLTLENPVFEELANGIEKWLIEDFATEQQKWIVEKFGDKLQTWLVEEFAPEIQKWVVEEYSPEVQNWTVEEFAPQIQNWIVEQYSPTLQNWLNEQFTPDMRDALMESVQEKISETIKESKDSKLANIDNMLTLLENHKVEKPKYGRQMIKENEDNEPLFIQQMPSEARVKWNMIDESQKETISRRAKLYNFAQPGAIEKFWESVDFDKVAPVNNINEGLDNVKDQWEKNIRLAFRRNRF